MVLHTVSVGSTTKVLAKRVPNNPTEGSKVLQCWHRCAASTCQPLLHPAYVWMILLQCGLHMPQAESQPEPRHNDKPGPVAPGAP